MGQHAVRRRRRPLLQLRRGFDRFHPLGDAHQAGYQDHHGGHRLSLPRDACVSGKRKPVSTMMILISGLMRVAKWMETIESAPKLEERTTSPSNCVLAHSMIFEGSAASNISLSESRSSWSSIWV